MKSISKSHLAPVVARWLSAIGRRGGAAGGAAKVRGTHAYYQQLGRAGAAARPKRKHP